METRLPSSGIARAFKLIESPAPLARRERTPPCRPSPSRRRIPQRQADRNDPKNQEATLKPPDTPIHRS
jgi:hypothetical protein